MVNTLEYTARAAGDRIAPGYDKTNTSTQMRWPFDEAALAGAA
jgi:hypothetical protein